MIAQDEDGSWLPVGSVWDGKLGNITPPEPILILWVEAAKWAMSTAGLVLATMGILWCSANPEADIA